MDDSFGPNSPPIPRQAHQHSRRKAIHNVQDIASPSSAYSRGLPSSYETAISSASPEVISSLITSLCVISKPTNAQHDVSHNSLQPLSFSSVGLLSPDSGSFGVDYGAYSNTAMASMPDRNVSLDELAASPPVIRTAKPPSGFSPLTAPKSPVRETSSSGGLKSLLSGRTSSRPSSKGSVASRDADTQSIGNLSVERGAVSPIPELRRRSSHDSWGKKTARSQKGLMYMSSKERLREKDAEKKRISIGAVGTDRLSSSGAISPRTDAFLAEEPISEESHHDLHLDSPRLADPRGSVDNGGAPSTHVIPIRDSSLRKTSSNGKRSSRRSSRHKNEPSTTDIIQETDEHHMYGSSDGYNQPGLARRSTQPARGRMSPMPMGGEEPAVQPSRQSRPSDREPEPRSFSLTGSSRQYSDINYAREDDPEDGAPFPAVSQGRHRYGSNMLDPSEGKTKRNSKLKRLSGPLSPRIDDKGAAADSSKKDRPSIEDTHVAYERPGSADSVDDAVGAYLCSPRLSQKIRHPQTGRIISFSEVGDSDGSAVFCCVGMGLTRYITAFYDELALTLKLRLITPDRPGIGDSEPYADGTATPLGWPDDVYAICQALKITKFSILAHSAGAIYALATALRMPQHIRGRIHLLAPWIPPSQMSVFGASAQTPLPPTNAIPTSQRILRALPTPILKAANSSFMSATSSSITSSLPKTPKRKRKSNANLAKEREKDAHKNHPLPTDNKENVAGQTHAHKDQAGLEDMDRIRPRGTRSNSTAGMAAASDPSGHRRGPSAVGHMSRESAVIAAAASAIAERERQAVYDTRLTHAIWELATTGANPAVDLLVCLERRHTIGFRYVDITRPVIIHHGSRDARVPVENVRWLGKTMRRCEVRVLEGEEHGLMASASVMGGVLMEIAKEWEDWGRLTGASGHRREGTRDERGRRGTVGMAH
ncbi:alpha beta hydrolase fold family [Grosmannia clavigera kw1407]|uniref:Alpha beta hydrolase fold family n=1 Tax=Grosmannia clavigera (strain kw1407 / UAMH 11150) TaxID=655863 RepID=F0XP84_GROCL|nr:alpha beta hydrolase fold family [Grosmannia clavigera kw1407]EFX00345.1 alpha beta hydrolase fold family [Grosmannia clavigera kw1407]